MKALLVTSSVTFVPENYDALVVGLAACPQIGGLLVLDNRSWAYAARAFVLAAIGAPRIAFHLLRNQLPDRAQRRREAYGKLGKPVWTLPTVNCEAARSLVIEHGFDLVINARTRCIYKKAFLNTPRLGCINIHHGLLPLQRGTMCDLWSLAEGQPAGFSVHQMNEKIDAGAIISTVQVSDGKDKSFPNYLAKASAIERVEITRLLAEIERTSSISGVDNCAPEDLVYRRNPSRGDIRRMRRGGLSL